MNQSLPYLGGLFILEHAENPGAFLSLGADMTKAWRFWIFSGVVGGGLLYACYYIIRRKNLGLVPTIASALVIAGGFGNLIDRLARGTVTDFMNFGFGSLRTGIFNVADIAITVGALLLVALSFRDSSKQEKENAA
jgi:signal peptidase II